MVELEWELIEEEDNVEDYHQLGDDGKSLSKDLSWWNSLGQLSTVGVFFLRIWCWILKC